ncbi:hypothetical protein GQ607_012953 [Colletotrichum asianum]|uniref:Uncharacterized protein n=1 Tax=Colletotrichum asianum TaxID=702518 RepID=A0A8H3W624_9PEZI|nr:hypothetical protein GQ607_012953 [Colletotrichum asianum]
MNRTRTAQQDAPQMRSSTGVCDGESPWGNQGGSWEGCRGQSCGAHQLNYSRPAFVSIASSYDGSDLNSRLPFWSALLCPVPVPASSVLPGSPNLRSRARCDAMSKASLVWEHPLQPLSCPSGEARQRRRLPLKPRPKPKPPCELPPQREVPPSRGRAFGRRCAWVLAGSWQALSVPAADRLLLLIAPGGPGGLYLMYLVS